MAFTSWNAIGGAVGNRAHRFAVLAATAVLGACAATEPGVVAPPPPPPPSSPTQPPRTDSTSPFVIAPSPGVNESDQLLFVSLPPGAIPGGEMATIRDPHGAASVTATMIDGGFDPVRFPAVHGDTLAISVRIANVAAPMSFVIAVPRPARPIVVRTEPPPHKRDVPLNAGLRVVFSEPIDPATLTATTVQLRSGSLVIAGQLTLINGDHTVAEVVPAAPLTTNTDYELVVTQGITDVDGNPLAAPVSVPFTTAGPGESPGEIAFTDSTAADGRALYLMQSDGTGRRRIAIDTYEVNSLTFDGWSRISWSPDRRRLAFEAGGALFGVNTDGSALGMVRMQPGSSDIENGAQTWSPDGTRVAFGSFTWYWVDQGTGIYITDPMDLYHGLPGSVVPPTRLTTGRDWWPSWSPDGREIVFARYVDAYFLNSGGSSGSDLYVINTDGSGIRQLTNNGWPISGVSWSPDGARIAFSADSGGCRAIWVMNRDGSSASRVTACGGMDRNPSWSPDGTRIAFERNRDIYAMNADGSGLARLTFSGKAVDPAWSR